MSDHRFQSREQWAACRQAPSDGDWDSLRTNTDLTLYASVAEIAAAIAALDSLYREEGRAMRAAKQAAAPAFARHPGDTVTAKYARFRDGTASEQVLLSAILKHRRDRREMADTLVYMRKGVVPDMAKYQQHIDKRVPAAAAILAEIGARFDVAHDADVEEMERKAAQRPIDDAAWEKELERRAGLLRWFGDPPGTLDYDPLNC